MRRRTFIAVLGCAAAWPLLARAQQAGKVVRIGFLGPALNSPLALAPYQALLARLRELGVNEGPNLSFENRGVDDAGGPFAAAEDLMRTHPDLIIVAGPEVALQAVVGASRAVPIVMIAVNFDPIARGYVASLARPGGNVTGVVFQQLEMAQKQVELLSQAFPERTRLTVFYDVSSADQFSAAELGVKAIKLEVRGQKLERPPYNFDDEFRRAVAEGAQMLLVLSSPSFLPQASRITALAIEYRLPAMFIYKAYPALGGLMSYGADIPLMFRHAADYVAKLLKGAKPADLPVEQAATFELVVNLKTAKAMGLKLPTEILLRADEVIE